MKVSQYTSAFAESPHNDIPLKTLLLAIKSDKWKRYIVELRNSEGDAFKAKKKKLPAFTATGTFDGRGDGAFQTHSGVVQIDIDGKDNPDLTYDQMWRKVVKCPHVYAAFKSPSGNGIKALFRCPPDRAAHAGSFYAGVQWLEAKGITVDKPVCALSQMCFISWDPDLYHNEEAVEIEPVEVTRDKAALVEYDESRDEEEILDACREQFEQFENLWAGDYPDAGFEDHSEADHALICMLRDNCHSNEMVAELFEKSGLYREEKWKGRTRDYVFSSLRSANAVQAVSMFDVVPDDPDDPEPERKKHKGWSWEFVGSVQDYKPEEDEGYLVKGMLHPKSVSVVYGAYATGKTFVVFDIAAAIASGREWFGQRTTKAGVLYFGNEGEYGIKQRMRGLKQEGKTVEGDPFARILFQKNAMNLMDPEHVKKAVQTIKAFQEETGVTVGWLVIDTLAKAIAGSDENSNKDIGLAVAHAQMIVDKTGWAVCLVHHPGKDPTKGPRGGYALPAGVDEVFEIARHEGDANIRIWRVKKQKDDKETEEKYFKLKTVVLGIDPDGEEKTTCVIERCADEEIPVKKEKGKRDTVLPHITVEGVEWDELKNLSGLGRVELNTRLKKLQEAGSVRKKGTIYYLIITEFEDEL